MGQATLTGLYSYWSSFRMVVWKLGFFECCELNSGLFYYCKFLGPDIMELEWIDAKVNQSKSVSIILGPMGKLLSLTRIITTRVCALSSIRGKADYSSGGSWASNDGSCHSCTPSKWMLDLVPWIAHPGLHYWA